MGQKQYVDLIRKKMIVFGIGPAGTGKTYLAMSMAIQAFKSGEVSRIILTRPAIEAGEKLGFLPGDLQSKIDPYLRPLYDALYQIMGAESYLHNSEKGLIEVAPLAYMRGRTLDNAFIILDEAQNTTPAQMKMFLTRIGFGSKVIVTGDQSQKDLPAGAASGLDTAIHVDVYKRQFLSWCVYLPVFLAVYPGIYSYDASAQLLQFYGKLPLTTHHPLIHTLYLGLCMKIAGRLFHTYQAGICLLYTSRCV